MVIWDVPTVYLRDVFATIRINRTGTFIPDAEPGMELVYFNQVMLLRLAKRVGLVYQVVTTPLRGSAQA